MLIDLHNHTSAFSECSSLSPEELCERAIASGLDGLVITEHDTYFENCYFQNLQREFQGRLVLFCGIEISIPGHHVLVIGSRIEPGPYNSLSTLTKAADNGKTALILAHPFRWFSLSHLSTAKEKAAFVRLFDAAEVASANLDTESQREGRQLFSAHNIPMVAGSDAHSLEMCATFATRFQHYVYTETALAEHIKAGGFTPVQLQYD